MICQRWRCVWYLRVVPIRTHVSQVLQPSQVLEPQKYTSFSWNVPDNARNQSPFLSTIFVSQQALHVSQILQIYYTWKFQKSRSLKNWVTIFVLWMAPLFVTCCCTGACISVNMYLNSTDRSRQKRNCLFLGTAAGAVQWRNAWYMHMHFIFHWST